VTSSDDPKSTTVNSPEKTFKVRLTVHTSSREEFRLDLGSMKESEREKLTAMVNGAFVIAPSKGWILKTEDGREYHFNSDHVVLVAIELS
jgi:hypothetical protein